MKNKFFLYFFILPSTAFLGTVLGFLGMMSYGGNFGCWAIVDAAFGTRGYESCASFGGIMGLFLGILLGLFVIHRLTYKKNSSFFSRNKIILGIWVLILLTTFGSFYWINTRSAAQQLANKEEQVENIIARSGLVSKDLPIEVVAFHESEDKLEATFMQGGESVSLRIIRGLRARDYVPGEENANVITLYTNESDPHVDYMTTFDYFIPPGADQPSVDTFKRTLFLAYKGLQLLEKRKEVSPSSQFDFKSFKELLDFLIIEEGLTAKPKGEIEPIEAIFSPHSPL